MAWRCSVRPERHSGARSCLPLAAPVGWDVRSKSGADTALPQVSGRASQERDGCLGFLGLCRPTLYPLLTNQSLNYFYLKTYTYRPVSVDTVRLEEKDGRYGESGNWQDSNPEASNKPRHREVPGGLTGYHLNLQACMDIDERAFSQLSQFPWRVHYWMAI